MTSLQSSSDYKQLNAASLRRSDRKRTKKIFKDDFMLPNPFKGKFKKHRGLRLPENLGCQIRKIQFLTQRTLSSLNYGKQQFSVEMLNEMKQAVNQQQIKLSEFLSIKLNGEKNIQESKIYLNQLKTQKISNNKENTPKIQQNTMAGEYLNDQELHKQVMGILTAEEFYKQVSNIKIQEEDNISALNDDSEFGLVQAPRFRKESSKLLSDNYENNELMYTIQHMIPSWHHEEHEIEEEQDFKD